MLHSQIGASVVLLPSCEKVAETLRSRPLITCGNVDAEVRAAVVGQRVLVAQARQHVGGVEARVVTQLAGDDLQRARVRVDKHLRFARYRARMLPAMSRQDVLRAGGFNSCCGIVLLHACHCSCESCLVT